MDVKTHSSYDSKYYRIKSVSISHHNKKKKKKLTIEEIQEKHKDNNVL